MVGVKDGFKKWYSRLMKKVTVVAMFTVLICAGTPALGSIASNAVEQTFNLEEGEGAVGVLGVVDSVLDDMEEFGTVKASASEVSGYWDGVFVKDYSGYFDENWKNVDRDIKDGTKCHVLSIGNKYPAFEDGWLYTKVAFEDGAIGYVGSKYVTQNTSVIAEVNASSLYAKVDLKLRVAPSNKATVCIALQGTKLTLLETQGNFYKVKTPAGDVGWIYTSSASVNKPKTVYITASTKLAMSPNSTSTWRNATVGTKCTVVNVSKSDGVIVAYEVKTPNGDAGWVSTKSVTTVKPNRVYSAKRIAVYKSADAGSKKLTTIAKGTKMTRLYTEKGFYQVSLSDATIGFVKIADARFTKVGKTPTKMYGLYYSLYAGGISNKGNELSGHWTVSGLAISGDSDSGLGYYDRYTRFIRVDSNFYPSCTGGKAYPSKVTSDGCTHRYIKVQAPDGLVGFVDLSYWVRSKSEAVKKTKIIEDVEGQKAALFQLNKIRQSKGLGALTLNKESYVYTRSVWKAYLQRFGTRLTHIRFIPGVRSVSEALPSIGSYGECTIQDESSVSAKKLMTRLIGDTTNLDNHGKVLLDPQYTQASIIVFEQNGDKFLSISLNN